MDELWGIEKCKLMKKKSTSNVLNHSFIIYPSVFNPNFFLGCDFFAQSFLNIIQEFHPHQPSILELGTGAGYNGILAALHGASHVTMTDINPDAIVNANENVQDYQLNNKITVAISDMFGSISPDNRYDIIFWNIPFENTEKSLGELPMLERAVYDPKHVLLDGYLKDVHLYLTPQTGRSFIGYSKTYGSMDDFHSLAKKYHWRIRCISEILYPLNQPLHLGFYEIIKIEKEQ